tara:strand:- start:37 stop:432 length:396 start_codon:yes stop_codon:yes gene_type:complete
LGFIIVFMGCLFCERETDKFNVIIENELFYSAWDNFAVSPGHALIIPKRHIDSFFDLSEKEILQFYDLLLKVKIRISKTHKPDAFNVGINDGIAAGRTIQHLHIHVIPRYNGDVENPRGGVRHIIPCKGFY